MIFKAWLNPLKCLEIDDLGQANSVEPTEAQLLDYLFAPEGNKGRDAFVARYREVACNERLFLAPKEDNLFQKLVWPLRSAKGSYALGNFLGCIAMCGMVGEMVAILLWNISKVRLKEKPWDEEAQKAIFGSTFEKLPQERRTSVLREIGMIKEDASLAFDGLRGIRRKYLHFFSQSHEQVATDARQAYKHASKLVNEVLGARIEGGAVVLRQDLVTYLAEHGIIEAVPEKQE